MVTKKNYLVDTAKHTIFIEQEYGTSQPPTPIQLK